MKKLVVGILAHVDAGKTTLSEAMLYTAGRIQKLGRVDNKDAFFDTRPIERSRGITVFSKQASFAWKDMEITLLDTPGHVDFSAEMERTLQVLDYAILVINGAEGVQSHTRTLWRLLSCYRIPVFLFVNKMDREEADAAALMKSFRELLSESCVNFEKEKDEAFYEAVAMCEEAVLEKYVEQGKIDTDTIKRLIQNRKVFPCFFGSALKLFGVPEFMTGMWEFCLTPDYPETFGARVFKIERDSQKNRLVFLKITGGSLQVKDTVTAAAPGEEGRLEEKINQIRLYTGEKYETVQKVFAGQVCAVTGLSHALPGDGLGSETKITIPLLEPVLSYQIKLPKGQDVAAFFPKLKQLAEEEPMLSLSWEGNTGEMKIRVMGQVQVEVLKSLIAERFGVLVTFGTGDIVYKETIAETVEGVGHFEPLKHYAEVHLLLEPLPAGSGLQFESKCSVDALDKNWQRLILTHLREKEHKGVLTGAAITDMKISVLGGRAHVKHTEGGDFREAAYRAVRQGLMRAKSILLEPWYTFRLEIPEQAVGRAMTDLQQMGANFGLPEKERDMTVLSGSAPVSGMKDYQEEVTAYSRGAGRLFCALKGYAPCHKAEEVIKKAGYCAESDLENPASSVFCAHGAGYLVEWDQVEKFMHVERLFLPVNEEETKNATGGNTVENNAGSGEQTHFLGTEEVDAILEKAGSGNRKVKGPKAQRETRYISAREVTAKAKGETAMTVGAPEAAGVSKTAKKEEKQPEYLLVDGYNVIFAWEDLKELAEVTIDGARGKLMDVLCNYQAIRDCELILVFDAYRVNGHQEEKNDYHNIHVVYTKEAETADRYIEKFAHENGRRYRVTVATSDGLEQIIIRGQGCSLMSARELKEEVERAAAGLRENWPRQEPGSRHYLGEHMPKSGSSGTF